MNAICVKSDNLEDWYTIERVEHEGRHWMERTTYGAKLMDSGRICDADVEGTSDEMIAIAKAIKTRTSVAFRRCEAQLRITTLAPDGDGYSFSSPRNSQESAFLTLAEADVLADSIIDVVTNTNLPNRG